MDERMQGADLMAVFCPACGGQVPAHKLVYNAQERKVAGFRCECGFIHAAGLDREDLLPGGLDGGISPAVPGDEGMNEGRKLPFLEPVFWVYMRSEPLQAADCSRRSQTATGSGELTEQRGLPPNAYAAGV